MTEEIQVPLSALEHYDYCPRQAGLILLESSYADDASTVRGNLLHQRVHEPGEETRPGVRVLRALPVWHDELGLNGVCDAVELHDDGNVVPIEYKAGSYVKGGPADVQLAAQAICLEARFATRIAQGYIYSGADRRRHAVPVDDILRRRVVAISEEVRAVLTGTVLPGPVADARCRRCSMNELCMPKLLANQKRYANELARRFRPAAESSGDD
ncbi:PD-(D/E)XK nuclease superfamily protein [Actinomadura rubteroloni]|uniref:CRISPR-associated exonuclease Cas4 n=1 Tax=Actinomadura rubteroloni TaxID=1926885 RepID=A0A2P4URX3_9ACTN|nr:CRISPR-associated protein Cas4 [Actinomadura rubteroloni]POM27788.1 PD-(D/E)XK nuclease superfamily protein [Actinomadura rubteroloni]